MKNILLLACILIMFLSFSANAQTTKIGVKLTVSADDSIKNDIESYTRREIRALNDVDLYATKPDYEIQLVVIKPSDIIAISVLVLHKYDFTTYINNSLPSKSVDAKTREDFIKTFAETETVSQHFLSSNSPYNLAELCKSIVTTIDADSFELERKLNRTIEDLINKKPNSTATQPKTNKQSTNTQPKQDNQPVFERRYVGGNKPPQIVVKNDADETLTLNFGSNKYTISAGQSQTINTADGGVFNFVASAPGIESLSGQKNFERGYIYTWKFYVVTVRR